MIKFQDINDREHLWENSDVRGVEKTKIFGSNKSAYFAVHSEGIEIEISERAFDDFLEAGFVELD